MKYKLLKYMMYLYILNYFTSCVVSSGIVSTGDELLMIPVDVAQNSPVKLSEISEDIKKVELETTKDFLIGHIVQVVCGDDRVFVLDAQAGSRIHVFDLSGKFLFAINKRGRGPGEYLFIKNITADKENKHLYIVSMSNKILRYDWDGKFIDEYTRVEFPEYACFENDLLHVFLYAPGRQASEHTFANTTVQVRYTRDWQPVDTMLVKSVILSSNAGTVLPNIDFISQDNRNNLFLYYPVLLNEPFARDTLYILDNNRQKPHIKLKFSDENNTKRNKNIFSISRTSHLLIAKYYSFAEKVYKYFCYDFRTKTGKNMTEGFIDDIFKTGFTEIRLLNNRYFYFVKETEISDDITLEPNPTLFIGKFKE